VGRLELKLAVDDERTALLEAIEESLRPLMRAAFAYGMSYQDMVDVARALYINAVRERQDAQGRPTSESRLGLMTGVTRAEVAKLVASRDEREQQRALAAKRTDQLSQFLSRWHDDPQFSTPYGAPLDLSLEPEGAFRTLDQLIEASGIELGRDEIISYLVQAGCVEVRAKRFVRCVSRTLNANREDIARILHVGRMMAAHNATLVRNLFAGESGNSFFESTTLSDFPMSSQGRDKFLAHLREEGTEFSNDVDRWILGKQGELSDPKGNHYGVSIFFFEAANQKAPFGAGELTSSPSAAA
jgi:molybdenum-dependent DNA-binding transcriptional regulator ModE